MKQLNLTNRSNSKLVDRFSRTISYLRLSVTDKCNLRCLYCMPCDNDIEDKSTHIFKNLPAEELLSYEELIRVVGVAVKLGMSKIRLTGGEPLVRKGVMGFIHKLSEMEGLEQIRLTTNGVLLKEKAQELHDTGVRHLNISLDTLNEDKFIKIAGHPLLQNVLDGIEKALSIGFRIKINIVAMEGINDDEFLDFAQLSVEKPLQVRFIEFMPIGKGSNWSKSCFIPSEKIREALAKKFILKKISGRGGDGPARIFTIDDFYGNKGKVGFISPISHHFCNNCNRLRLTSEGKLRACLLHDHDTDLKHILRNDCSDLDIETAIRETILFKPKGHEFNSDTENTNQLACRGNMSRIGG